jgi:hypothetical protein
MSRISSGLGGFQALVNGRAKPEEHRTKNFGRLVLTGREQQVGYGAEIAGDRSTRTAGAVMPVLSNLPNSSAGTGRLK